MSAVRTLYDHQGLGWMLDQEVNVGGEGAIYTVASKPGLLAKIYLKPPASETIDKLRHMLRAGAARLHKQAAWPVATLHKAPAGPVVGFLMPRFADYRPLHNLYLLTARKRLFPDAEWDFLIRAAQSSAAAFAAVHARGVVIGDVNQGNVLVSASGSVALIDCDSFQVEAAGRIFPCLVGVPEFTPPELQQVQSFRGLVRSVNHDRFGLAVLIFYLLLMGKHPFAGRPTDDREMDLDNDIRNFRFAYGRGAAALKVAPPPLSPTLDVLSAQLRDLFERAFTPGSEAVGRRPSAEQWQEALAQFRGQLRPCAKDPAGHKVPEHLRECPWCRIVDAGGPDFFAGVAAVGAEFTFDRARLTSLCQRGKEAANRGIVEVLPSHAGSLPPGEPLSEEAQGSRALSRIIGGTALAGIPLLFLGLAGKGFALFGLAVLLVFGTWWGILRAYSAYGREKQERQQAFQDARRALAAAKGEIRQLQRDYQSQRKRLVEHINQLGHEWQRLPEEYQAELGYLEHNREALARTDFLRSRLLADSEIPKVGRGRKQTLASYGIESADDVSEQRIRAIKGFGPTLTASLLEWRKQVEAEFHFDPASGVPQAEAQALALKYKQQQDSLRLYLDQELKQLELLISRTEQDCHPLWARARQLSHALDQAEADREVVSARS